MPNGEPEILAVALVEVLAVPSHTSVSAFKPPFDVRGHANVDDLRMKMTFAGTRLGWEYFGV